MHNSFIVDRDGYDRDNPFPHHGRRDHTSSGIFNLDIDGVT